MLAADMYRWLVFLAGMATAAQTSRQYDVVVVGAGAGGVGAAVQAARMGARVALLEETDWIGGQMTAAAVSTMDETGFNPESGIYAEFSERIRVHYARMGKAIGTCASSPRKTCFEPSVGRAILTEMIEDTRKSLGPGKQKRTLDLFLQRRAARVLSEGSTVTGVVAQTGEEFRSKVVIDATEYGDVLPLSPARYRMAWFTSDDAKPKGCMQHITYTTVIRKYFDGVPPELVMKHPPPGYTSEIVKRFQGEVADVKVPGPKGHPRSFAAHNSYRGLPDSKNPESYTREEPEKITKTGVNMTNDFAVTLEILDRSKRKAIECQAKLLTLQFLYYVQTELKETQWAIANDEGYDTPYNREQNSCPNIPAEFKALEWNFPQMPYVRESRRVIGMRTFAAPLLQRAGNPPVTIYPFPSAIAVGDYAMDLHACDGDETIETTLEKHGDQQGFMTSLGPFQVPLQSLIPEKVDGLMVAEKNLSQSRLVNGATRLQPIAMMVGQASGATAALAALHGIAPRAVTPGAVQRALVDAGARLTPLDYPDTPKMVRHWADIQIVSAQGLMSAVDAGGFAPYRALKPPEFQQIVERLAPGTKLPAMQTVSRDEFRQYLKRATGLEPDVDMEKAGAISRAEAAAVLAKLLVKKDVAHAMEYWPVTRK
ncbi:MAG: pyruvate/2-oxoglutarate dehydrogenase complex, dihydrolipoamide dehydrogenase component [Candidatus Solibacter sp.]|nr:pyruvate/2-oxoglutarate dehydrogenase complex, dihydrolipoamide dehydrogenase component [Candidatus Solibacter sp.]